jgi:hypothetical protein
MGLALRLFPVDMLQNNFGICGSLLELGGISWDLGATISKLARRLPDGHDITAHSVRRMTEGPHKGERCYGRFDTDAYGETYRWLTVHELRPLLIEHWPGHPVTEYISALVPDQLIVLDWH